MLQQKLTELWGFNVIDLHIKKLVRLPTGRCRASTVVSDMIPVVITILVTGILALCYVSWISDFETKETINAITREYLLRMGTVGYLSNEDKSELLSELEDKNIEDISLLGTTDTKVESGEIVTLKISGKYKCSNLKFVNVFLWQFNDSTKVKKDFCVEKCTTAIY